MRNLALTTSNIYEIPAKQSHCTISALDLDENTLYTAFESETEDSQVSIDIWKTGLGYPEEDSLLAFTFTAMPGPKNASNGEVISMHILPETRRIVLILKCGDITTLSLDEEGAPAVVEGTVDFGAASASWSPDDSLLVLITTDGKLLLMTSMFDVVAESPLQTTEFGEDVPINVGWGSKQTQFHGSLGKAAAHAAPQTNIGSSPDEDHIPRVSWRGDGAFFVVSTLTTSTPRRVLRSYNRQGALQSTSEAVPGLEHPLSWRPSGNLIVSTQRFGFDGGGAGKEGRHDVIFFERNGLRHGEFGIRASNILPSWKPSGDVSARLRWGYRVKDVIWSSDSDILALWIETDEGDIVQLWATGNYHWYLKHEIHAPTLSRNSAHFTSILWHPEQALRLILTTNDKIIQRTYSWDTVASQTTSPFDSGTVVVFDGTAALLTPFRLQNVPPPMCTTRLDFRSNDHVRRSPVSLALSYKEDIASVLWESGDLQLWNFNTRISSSKGPSMNPKLLWSGSVGDDPANGCRQTMILCHSNGYRIVVLGSGMSNEDQLAIISIEGSATSNTIIRTGEVNGRLVSSEQELYYQNRTGKLFRADVTGAQLTILDAQFSEFCFSSQSISTSREVFVGLSHSGKLYAVCTGTPAVLLSSQVTSFTVASDFVIFTTTSHEAKFIPVSELFNSEDASTVRQKRRVERGSKIVVAVPSAMSLILQMPRGNLETINPRPFVLKVVYQDLDNAHFGKAFKACRKHRIDLDVLTEHNLSVFMERVSDFVDQVDDPDYINLFLTSIGRGKQPQETVAAICDAVRKELEERDLVKYTTSILTSHVAKSPPDYESALGVLVRLRERDESLVEDAVKYVIFLVDANVMFDVALGMYDFSLVLMVAQYAQKDPREYLPFLRELRSLDEQYQKFRIDDHLKRYEKALHDIAIAGPERFDEAIKYVEDHQLYSTALLIWKGTEHYPSVLSVYGDHLFERREFSQAAIVFTEAKALQKAMVAHERAMEWQPLFDIALQLGTSEEELRIMAYRVAEDLLGKKRTAESARVLLDYAQDTREAVVSLVQGNHIYEARRVITMHKVPELLEEIVYPGTLENCNQCVEEIGEMSEQLRKQVTRIKELRKKKVEEPDAFYGMEDTQLHNVDVMTDVSQPYTAFTRYTAAPTALSKTSSKRTSRSKRKMELKIGAGRKGTVNEEEYLLNSLAKLVRRLDGTRSEARSLIANMTQFTSEHRDHAQTLQSELSMFETDLQVALDEVWKKPLETSGETGEDTWAARMEELEKKRIDPTEKITKPLIPTQDWRSKLFELGL